MSKKGAEVEIMSNEYQKKKELEQAQKEKEMKEKMANFKPPPPPPLGPLKVRPNTTK